MPISGYSADLPGDVLMDTGVLWIGNAILGATRGAPNFDPGKEFSNIDFDGKRSDLLGLDRVDRYDPVLSGMLIEFDTPDLARFEPGSTSAGTGTVVHTPKAAGTLFASGDYMTDLRLIFERGVNPGTFAAIHFPKALCTRYRVAGNKNDIALIEFEFRARRDMSSGTLFDAPYKIELRDALPS